MEFEPDMPIPRAPEMAATLRTHLWQLFWEKGYFEFQHSEKRWETTPLSFQYTQRFTNNKYMDSLRRDDRVSLKGRGITLKKKPRRF